VPQLLYPWETSPWYSFDRRLGGAPVGGGKDKTPLPLPRIES